MSELTELEQLLMPNGVDPEDEEEDEEEEEDEDEAEDGSGAAAGRAGQKKTKAKRNREKTARWVSLSDSDGGREFGRGSVGRVAQKGLSEDGHGGGGGQSRECSAAVGVLCCEASVTHNAALPWM